MAFVNVPRAIFNGLKLTRKLSAHIPLIPNRMKVATKSKSGVAQVDEPNQPSPNVSKLEVRMRISATSASGSTKGPNATLCTKASADVPKTHESWANALSWRWDGGEAMRFRLRGVQMAAAEGAGDVSSTYPRATRSGPLAPHPPREAGYDDTSNGAPSRRPKSCSPPSRFRRTSTM